MNHPIPRLVSIFQLRTRLCLFFLRVTKLSCRIGLSLLKNHIRDSSNILSFYPKVLLYSLNFLNIILMFPDFCESTYVWKPLPYTLWLNTTEFQHILIGATEISHLCGWSICMNPLHLTSESHGDNMRRKPCFQRARILAANGDPVEEQCS